MQKNKSNYELIQVAKNSAITELVHKLDYDLDKWIEFSTTLCLKPSELIPYIKTTIGLSQN